MADRQRNKFKIIRTASTEPMSARDLETVEAILARMVALAYVADHPGVFGPKLNEVLSRESGEKGRS